MEKGISLSNYENRILQRYNILLIDVKKIKIFIELTDSFLKKNIINSILKSTNNNKNKHKLFIFKCAI